MRKYYCPIGVRRVPVALSGEADILAESIADRKSTFGCPPTDSLLMDETLPMPRSNDANTGHLPDGSPRTLIVLGGAGLHHV